VIEGGIVRMWGGLRFKAGNVENSVQSSTGGAGGRGEPSKGVMARHLGKKSCPQCGSIVYRRIRRKLWMQLLPGARHFECLECFKRFLAR